MDQKCRICMPQHWIEASEYTCQFTTEGIYGNRKLTSVAAHVQADTIPDAIRPGLMLRDALLNSSEFFGEYAVYLA